MSREILEAMHALAREKGIEPEKLMIALEDALLSAYKKQPGSAKYARVEIDRETADFRVIELIIPERLEAHLIVETIDEETVVDPETGEMREPRGAGDRPREVRAVPRPDRRARRHPRRLRADRRPDRQAGDPAAHPRGRARHDVRGVPRPRRRAVTGIVQQSDSRYTLVQLRERVEALLPKSEQVDGERYDHSQRIKAVIKEVSPSTKGPSIIVSRRDPELIKKLFELEVPEIADGLVEIAGVAREPGYRSKIAVISHADGVDPVGACVGPRGSRVRMVVSELRGEKIDIIPYNDEPARFVAKALSPARVREVLVDDEAKQATVIVPDDQLSLAIGREGQNARLAARLTGWRVDIRSETEFAAEEAEQGYGEEEEVSGRCAAILSNGRRCPNASLPGSRYCGLDAHQALANIDSDRVVDLAGGEQDEAPDEQAPAAADDNGAAAARWRMWRRPLRWRMWRRPPRGSRTRNSPRSRRHSRPYRRSADAPAAGGSPARTSSCAWRSGPRRGRGVRSRSMSRRAWKAVAPTCVRATAGSLRRSACSARWSAVGSCGRCARAEDRLLGPPRIGVPMSKKRVHEIAKEQRSPARSCWSGCTPPASRRRPRHRRSMRPAR